MVKITLTDTGGIQRFRSLNSKLSKNNDSIILIYSINDKRSFEECKEYYKDNIKQNCKNNTKVILIGNKIDLEDRREVTTEEGYNFALENGYLFMEISCLTNDNIYDAFEAIIYETLLIKMKEEENKDSNEEKRILLKEKNKQCIVF